jgi:hypothetical protein
MSRRGARTPAERPTCAVVGENYQIAWMTFASVAYRCRTSSLREAVTAWRGTKVASLSHRHRNGAPPHRWIGHLVISVDAGVVSVDPRVLSVEPRGSWG